MLPACRQAGTGHGARPRADGKQKNPVVTIINIIILFFIFFNFLFYFSLRRTNNICHLR
jgi:fumarate reductase subunit C